MQKIKDLFVYLMQFTFSKEECLKAKSILGKNGTISTIWRNNFAPSNRIGNCTNLYRKLKPVSVDDFYEKYIEYGAGNPDMPISQRGLSYDELYALAERYKKVSEEKTGVTAYDLSVFFYDALCHIIVETWDGQQNERDFVKFLTSLGYKCSKFDGRIDAEYGVDIKVERGDGVVSAIQIKPISFFKSNRHDVHMDRVHLCEKYEEALKNLKFKTYYAIYVKDKETGDITWVKNGNGYRFRINELFNYNPVDISGTFTRLPIPEVYEKLPI